MKIPIVKYSDKFLDKVSWFMKVGGIALFPYIVLREDHKYRPDNHIVVRHETIHIKQQIELLVLLFYVVYLVLFLINIFKYRTATEAYYNIAFEKEARYGEEDENYLKDRKLYSWVNFI